MTIDPTSKQHQVHASVGGQPTRATEPNNKRNETKVHSQASPEKPKDSAKMKAQGSATTSVKFSVPIVEMSNQEKMALISDALPNFLDEKLKHKVNKALRLGNYEGHQQLVYEITVGIGRVEDWTKEPYDTRSYHDRLLTSLGAPISLPQYDPPNMNPRAVETRSKVIEWNKQFEKTLKDAETMADINQCARLIANIIKTTVKAYPDAIQVLERGYNSGHHWKSVLFYEIE